MSALYFSQRAIRQLKRIQLLLDQLQPDAEPKAVVVPGSPQPRGTVVVFPGSFNPPTIAHLALLKEAHHFLQARFPDHREPALLYAAFSKRTVDKENVERPLLLERVHLLEVILKRRLPHAGIILFNRGLYVEQAQAMRVSFPGIRRLLFLIGYDKIVQIFDPHYYTDRDAALVELFNLADLLVAPRGSGGEHEIEELTHQPQNERFARHVHIMPFTSRYRTISATQVRQSRGNEAQAIPWEVRQFIRETRVYTPPVQQSDGTQLDYYEKHIQQLEQLLHYA
jgi:nicotinic acid mononucleotide adenylyltransferase